MYLFLTTLEEELGVWLEEEFDELVSPEQETIHPSNKVRDKIFKHVFFIFINPFNYFKMTVDNEPNLRIPLFNSGINLEQDTSSSIFVPNEETSNSIFSFSKL